MCAELQGDQGPRHAGRLKKGLTWYACADQVMKECRIPVPVEVSEVLLRHIGKKGLNGAKIGEESVLKIYEMEGLWGSVPMSRTPCSYRPLAGWCSCPQGESVIPSVARESGDLLQSGVVKMSFVRPDLPEEGV